MVLITRIESAKFLCRNVSTSLWKKGSNTSQKGCTSSYVRKQVPEPASEALLSDSWLCDLS